MKMHRSRTVTLSAIVFALWIAGWISGVIPAEVDQSSGIWWYIGLLFFAAMIRIIVLYWQTLIHSIKHAPQDSRVSWVVGHFLLGPIVAVPYYYLNRVDRVEAKIVAEQVAASDR